MYRKYRSKSLAEIIGQEHITDTLSNALATGNVSHAYLFTGPRGVGKTSIARIMAYEVNGLPYNENLPHLDIIEIDAASNRRIDEVRDLKERVHIAPTSAKYKVYIIDEVHMLTREAFNALLKTLEEPPEHAIFILATTEAHKVPETIISRTQRFAFKPVSTEKVFSHLKDIAKAEKIKIDDEALGLIASHGEGSFRDSISLLDQLRHMSDTINADHARQALGQAPTAWLMTLLAGVRGGNLKDIANELSAMSSRGTEASQIARQLSLILRQSITGESYVLPPKATLDLLSDLSLVPSAADPSLKLELVLYAAALPFAEELTSTKKSPAPAKSISKHGPEPDAPIGKDRLKPAITKTESAAATDVLSDEIWSHILSEVKSKHNTLYGITRMAQPRFTPGKITLTFSFNFHHKRLSETRNQQALLRVIKNITGQDIILECIIDKALPAEQSKESIKRSSNDDDLNAISNIFGGAEVVE